MDYPLCARDSVAAPALGTGGRSGTVSRSVWYGETPDCHNSTGPLSDSSPAACLSV